MKLYGRKRGLEGGREEGGGRERRGVGGERERERERERTFPRI